MSIKRYFNFTHLSRNYGEIVIISTSFSTGTLKDILLILSDEDYNFKLKISITSSTYMNTIVSA